MKFNKKHCLRFKRFFHGDERVTLQRFPERKGCTVKPGIMHGTLTASNKEKLKKANEAGAAICILINRGNGEGRKVTDIEAVTAVFVDADGDLKLALKNAPIRPQLIVKTSPGHYHAYWKIGGMPLDVFKLVQMQLADKFGTDRSVNDLARVMRVPGSINWKHAEPFVVKIIYQSRDIAPISWKKFCRKMGLPIATDKSAAAKPMPRPAPDKHDMVKRITKALHVIPADDRQVWLTIGMAIHSELPDNQGYKIWTDWSKTANEKFDEKDQARTWEKLKLDGGVNIGTLFWYAQRASETAATGVPDNELEMAELFAANCQDRLRYVEAEKKWYAWDGKLWQKSNSAAYRLLRDFIKIQSAPALRPGAGGPHPVKRYQTPAALHSMLAHASTLSILLASKAAFDGDTNVLAVQNGVVELANRTFRAATPADMVSVAANVTYDPNAKCPRWRRFLAEITNGDDELARFLQLAVGYTLYGHTKAQVFFILIGSGSNGKGVFLRTLYTLLDQYALILPGAILLRAYANASGPSPALAKVNGRRFLMCTEVPTRPLDEAFVKALSGSDPLSARGLYAEQQEFLPVGKLWLSVNEMPMVRFDDDAMWRRIVLIPFKRRFLKEKCDPDLEQKLAEEKSGILNWALAGAVRYANEGLELCAESKAMLKRIRKDTDTVEEWIKNACIKKPEAVLPASAAYQSYSDYMRKQSRRHLKVPEFRAALIRKGYESRRRMNFNGYLGLRLRDD